MKTPAKLVIIGLDAGDKDLVLEWVRKGKLPNIKRLMERSTWGETINPPGMEAGSTWPSFYTGLSAAKHGMYYAFEQPRKNAYGTRPFEAEDFTGEPFWDVMSRAGKRVAVIDAPYTYVSKKINGIHIVDWGGHAPMAGINNFDQAFQTWPTELKAEIERKYGRDHIGYCDMLHFNTLEQYRNFRDDLVDRTRRRTALMLDILGRGNWDCFFGVYHECHCIGHQCWHFHDPAHPRHNKAMVDALGDIVQEIYELVDVGIGQILDLAGPDANVVLLCSHGMAADYTGSLMLDDILLRLEEMHIGEGGKGVVRAVHKAWLNLPRAIQQVVKPLRTTVWPVIRRNVLEPDRRKRKCYEIRNNDATGGIRLNLVGREPNGILKPGPEADAFCDQLIKDLLELKVPATGKAAVAKVIRTEQMYSGPRSNDLPDLLVDWNREGPILSVTSPKIGVIENQDLPSRTGDHRPSGMFWAAGPSFQAQRLNEAISVYSFSPTILSLFGIEQIADGPIAEPIIRGASLVGAA
jgi:predicted AlkP superfamily phosphohydrolase/phosphomutase